jgi:hypothetical protein
MRSARNLPTDEQLKNAQVTAARETLANSSVHPPSNETVAVEGWRVLPHRESSAGFHRQTEPSGS